MRAQMLDLCSCVLQCLHPCVLARAYLSVCVLVCLQVYYVYVQTKIFIDFAQYKNCYSLNNFT